MRQLSLMLGRSIRRRGGLIEPAIDAAVTKLTALARRNGWRLLVLFGSIARGEEGRDLDLAVLPTAMPGLLEQGRWQAELEDLFAPRPLDLLLLGAATSPVTLYQVFRDGRCLFEAEPGLFDRQMDRAFFLFADSEYFRRQQRGVLYGLAR